MTVIKRRQLPAITSLIETHHPSEFFSVDELQSATSEGVFPTARSGQALIPVSLGSLVRLVLPRTREASSCPSIED